MSTGPNGKFDELWFLHIDIAVAEFLSRTSDDFVIFVREAGL